MPTAPGLADILRKSGLLPTLTREDFALLAPVFERRSFAANEVLFKEGDSGDYLVIVVQGSLVVMVDKFEQGVRTRKTIAKVNPHSVVGDMSCMDPSPRSATVMAQEETDVLILSRATLDRLRMETPPLFTKVVHGLAHRVSARLRETEAKIALGLRGTAAEPVGDKSTVFGKLFSAFSSPQAPPKSESTQQDRSLPQVVIDKKAAPPREALTDFKLPRENAFTLFSPEELAELASKGKSMTFPEGSVLTQEGTPTDSCFLVVAGEIDVIKSVGERMHMMSKITAGSMVGQVGLVDGGSRNVTLRARNATSIVKIDQERFQELFQGTSLLALHFQELVITACIRQLRMAMWADAGRWAPGWS